MDTYKCLQVEAREGSPWRRHRFAHIIHLRTENVGALKTPLVAQQGLLSRVRDRRCF